MHDLITSVIQALQRLEIKSTYGNLNILLGSIQTLQQVADKLEVNDDGRQAGHPEPGNK